MNENHSAITRLMYQLFIALGKKSVRTSVQCQMWFMCYHLVCDILLYPVIEPTVSFQTDSYLLTCTICENFATASETKFCSDLYNVCCICVLYWKTCLCKDKLVFNMKCIFLCSCFCHNITVVPCIVLDGLLFATSQLCCTVSTLFEQRLENTLTVRKIKLY